MSDLRSMIQASLNAMEEQRAANAPKEEVQAEVLPLKPSPSSLPQNQPRLLAPAMDRATVSLVSKTIKAGDKVRIQFKVDSTFDVIYLIGMNDQILSLNEYDLLMVWAVKESGEWGTSPTSRIMEFTALEGWDNEWFSGRLDRRLEAIEILPL